MCPNPHIKKSRAGFDLLTILEESLYIRYEYKRALNITFSLFRDTAAVFLLSSIQDTLCLVHLWRSWSRLRRSLGVVSLIFPYAYVSDCLPGVALAAVCGSFDGCALCGC